MDQPKSLCHGRGIFCEIEHNCAFFHKICDSPQISNTLVSFVKIVIIDVNADLTIHRVAEYCIMHNNKWYLVQLANILYIRRRDVTSIYGHNVISIL